MEIYRKTEIIKTIDVIFQQIDKARKAEKNEWYYSKSFEYRGKLISINSRGFGFYIKMLTINGVEHTMAKDCLNISDFKISIYEAIHCHI